MNRVIRVGEMRGVKESFGFAVRATGLVLNGGVELGDFSLKFLFGSNRSKVGPDVDALFAKEAVAADVIEVLFGVNDAKLVAESGGGGVAVERLRRERVGAGIDYQGQ